MATKKINAPNVFSVISIAGGAACVRPPTAFCIYAESARNGICVSYLALHASNHMALPGVSGTKMPPAERHDGCKHVQWMDLNEKVHTGLYIGKSFAKDNALIGKVSVF